ncbi:MAG: hypothetical protein P8H59_01735 [Flavobacteriales bacterium]|nr:hypothetical protein [Flavobacteriales bacterium]MDG1779644.1 hypothetical protein [Flavobacteriales bacterium]MDG2245539.1 hypothetical protein [Flavobacteriales bacterium]
MNSRINTLAFCLIGFLLLTLTSCDEVFTPRPKGYFRIHLPQKEYLNYTTKCDISSDLPIYSKIEIVRTSSDSCWYNIVYPQFNAKIHCTYLPVKEDIGTMIEDAYVFAFKHESKANAIKRSELHENENNMHGMVYDLTGNVASPIQFFATDSTNHFLRGALYFSHAPNADSLAPVRDFIREDIIHMMKTINWEP